MALLQLSEVVHFEGLGKNADIRPIREKTNTILYAVCAQMIGFVLLIAHIKAEKNMHLMVSALFRKISTIETNNDLTIFIIFNCKFRLSKI